ncbi:adenylate/guanylate cyclase domain-containing protein [Mesorhizobium sp. WSM2240]
MERDEAGTFERLKTGRKELFEPEIALHHGRIFKLMGDGLLAEFSSVVDAVECAVSLQRGLWERNANVPEDQRVQVRIGINLGEVIVDGDDRYGDGVNIAARLEQLADPGGIWVSAKVAREVEKKLAFGFEAMGEQKVKNIAEAVQAFRIKFDGILSRVEHPKKNASYRSVAAIIGVLALLIAGAGAWYGLQRPAALAREPSIAVLPFANMSGDPAQDYLGAGIAEDIITMLSSFPTLRVVSRTSSFVYDKPVKVQQVGEDLKVNYVLEGSVRKTGDHVRVTAQLIDALTGDHLWANRYDEEGTNVAALQDDVANTLYGTLAGLRGEVMKREEAEAWSKSAPGLQEYDYYLRGHQLFFRFTKEDNAAARQVWQEGLAKFPDSALLRTKIAFTYILGAVYGWTDDPWRDTELAWKVGTEAAAIPNKSRLETFLGHWSMAILYQFHEGDFERSVVEAEAAIKLVPYDALSRADLAMYLANAGETDRAIEWLEEAIRRDASPMDWYFTNLGIAYYNAGRPADAVAQFQKNKVPSDVNLAAAYARLGKLDEARATIARLLSYKPGWTLQKEAVWPAGKHPQFVEPLQSAYLADLAKAGLPEK